MLRCTAGGGRPNVSLLAINEAAVITFAAVSTLYMPKLEPALFEAIWNLAGSVFSFMFGDRMYFKFGKR